MSRIKSIYLIAQDTIGIASREKGLYGFIILGLLFVAMTNLPFALPDLEAFKGQTPTTNALQVGLGFINIFIILIAIFVSIGTLENCLRGERLVLILSKPIKRYELLLGIILGLVFILFLNWFLLTFGLWLVIFLHTKNLGLYIFLGLAPNIFIGIICISLVVFFYNFIPNFLSGILTFFILIASFGAAVSEEPFKGVSPLILAKSMQASLWLLPKVNSLWGIAMNTLRIFKITVNSPAVILHTLIFIVVLNTLSLIRFNRVRI